MEGILNWFDFINPLGFILGSLVTFVLTQLKTIGELKKQSIESRRMHLELYQELLKTDSVQVNALQELHVLSNKLTVSIEDGDKGEFLKHREALVQTLTLGYVRAFYKYFRLARVVENKSDSKFLILSELLPFLETCSAYLVYINNKTVLDLFNIKKPLTLNPSTFLFVTSFIRANTSFYNFRIRKRLRVTEKYIKKYLSQ